MSPTVFDPFAGEGPMVRATPHAPPNDMRLRAAIERDLVARRRRLDRRLDRIANLLVVGTLTVVALVETWDPPGADKRTLVTVLLAIGGVAYLVAESLRKD